MIEEPLPKNYSLLKGIVIALGVLIVVMLFVIIIASVMKYNEQKSDEAALVDKYQTSQVSVTNTVKPFEMNLKLEDGQQIISTSSSDKGILVTVGQNGNAQKILLVDYTGKITGIINVN
jgi:hypothetical protein